MIASLAQFEAFCRDLPQVDERARAEASARNDVLTKPPGALGRLEDLALWYAGWRGEAAPRVSAPQLAVFAGNHGVTAQGISAFPPEVTAQMVLNFEAGGAAINQLAKESGASMTVVPLDLDQPTGDFTVKPAMTEADVCAALTAGWEAVSEGADLLVVGEMGIGNTTSAAARAVAAAARLGDHAAALRSALVRTRRAWRLRRSEGSGSRTGRDGEPVLPRMVSPARPM